MSLLQNTGPAQCLTSSLQWERWGTRISIRITLETAFSTYKLTKILNPWLSSQMRYTLIPTTEGQRIKSMAPFNCWKLDNMAVQIYLWKNCLLYKPLSVGFSQSAISVHHYQHLHNSCLNSKIHSELHKHRAKSTNISKCLPSSRLHGTCLTSSLSRRCRLLLKLSPRGNVSPRGIAVSCYSNNDERYHPYTCNRAGCGHGRCSACTTTTTWF